MLLIVKRFATALLLIAPLLARPAVAELAIEVTQGRDNPTSIAIVPIQMEGTTLPENISSIVAADLERSGLFAPVPKENLIAFPRTAEEVYFRDWRILGAEYLVVGQIQAKGPDQLAVSYSLLSVNGEKMLFSEIVPGQTKNLRDIAHYISDKVYEAITGVRGAFSTRLAYVTAVKGASRKLIYRLLISDADGARERLMLESKQPLMSPAWSPNGQEVVYVSFETRRPAVFRQRLSDAKRQQLTNFKGLNGAPSWSPDGNRLALVLSKDGNPEIYLFDLGSQALTRLTNHFAIDTEPSWMPDGKSILFTSDRGGGPQIYKLTLGSQRVERLTFNGSYNSRPQVTPDGRTLLFVHRGGGGFNIASQDLASGDMRVLTNTAMAESPSVAPNGAMAIYATKRGNQGVLAAVSLDTRVKFLLPVRQGDVREPAWSPFLGGVNRR